MKEFKVVECSLFDCSYEDFLEWKDRLSSFILDYTKGKYISIFDGLYSEEYPEELTTFLPFEFIFKYKNRDFFFACGKDSMTKDDIDELLSLSGFIQEYCAIIPSLLSDVEKIELVSRWYGDRACSNIEMFTKGCGGGSFKWYNPPYSDAEKILSEQLDIDGEKLGLKTYQVLESIVDKNDYEKYNLWKKGLLSFIYDYLKGKSITFLEPDYKKRKISNYISNAGKMKYCGEKMCFGYIENGISLEILTNILNEPEFMSGNIALIPSFLSEDNLVMLFNSWKIDKISPDLEMFMMDNEGRSFKWYNPDCENSYELFDSCFGNDNVPH